MKPQKLHITILFILLWGFVFGQEYTNYSTKEGLPSNHVYRITQDHDGFIWIITDKGISKFDGKTFKNFTTKNGLPTNDIWHIRITPDNKIWYFSKSTKLGYIFKDRVYAFSAKTDEMLFPGNISQSKNIIAFDTGKFRYQLKDSIWQKQRLLFNIKNTDFTIQSTIHSTIDAYSIDAKLKKFSLHKKDKKVSFPIAIDAIDPTRENNQINDSLYVVIGKEYYIIANFDSEKIKQVTYLSQSLPKRQKYFRSHYVNNEIQFTGLNFVASLASDLDLIDKIDIPKKLNSHFSFVDKTGNIWCATFNKGVFMLPQEKTQVKIVAKNKKIQAIALVNNTVYTGVFQEGFFKLSDTLHPIVKNNDFQYSICSIDSSNTILLSSQYGIHSYKNNKITTLNIHTKDEDSLYNLFLRKFIQFKGGLYGYSSAGIEHVNPENYTINERFDLYGVTSFSKNDTNLFTGNQGGLIQLINNDFVSLQSHPLFNKPVLCQENLDATNIIVGTDGFGAYITDGVTVKFVENSEELSLQDIFVDADKNIWLASQKGVHKVTKESEQYAVTRSFYESDGLLSNNINCLVIKNDTLVVGTDLGISMHALDQKTTNQLQRVYIKSIEVDSMTTKSDTISYTFKKNNPLSISFGVINYGNQSHLSYEYRLSPVQQKWISTTATELNFTSLAPDMYTLEFKVKNHHHEELTKTVFIEIQPLWTQTSWFMALAISIFALIISIIAWWLSKKSQENKNKTLIREKRLSEIQLLALRSQMNPHFVFNSLNAIQYYMNKNEVELSEKYLVKFSRLIRMFFDFSREQFITIAQELELLKGYLEIEKMRFGDDFKFQFTIDPTLILETKMPTMLLQPIIENAVNHGLFHQEGKGLICIDFKNNVSKNGFTVCVKDNGIGFKLAQQIKEKSIKNHTSKASEIIRDRIDLINNSSSWEITQKITDLTTEETSGTSVVLTFKKK